jgi:PAS domain S-box-containing protein
LVEDLPDIVYEVDAQRRFSFVSRSVTSILGYNPEEMLGRTRREFVHPMDRERYDRDRHWTQEGDMMNISAIRHLTKDGQIRWLSSHSRGLYDKNGLATGRRGVARDVTQQVVAEMRVRELSRKLINAQEEERKRIALDLHDEMGQLLSALKMGLQAMARQQGSLEGQEMEKLIRLNQTVMDRTRALAHWLRPAILDNFGLRAAVEDLCETLAESHLVQVNQRLEEVEEKRLSPEVKISLFRFAQEALSNAVKHSGSSLVEVRLAQDNHQITLSVMDFGKGFDLEKALSGGKHLGLLGMKERLSLIGGKLDIITSPQGTKLSVELSLDGSL